MAGGFVGVVGHGIHNAGEEMALVAQHFIDPFLDRPRRDVTVDEHGLFLTHAPTTILSLHLPNRVPVSVEVKDVVRVLEVEASTSCLG